jgi:glucose-6-phosphate dehydrogenase assembly protein OpcA
MRSSFSRGVATKTMYLPHSPSFANVLTLVSQIYVIRSQAETLITIAFHSICDPEDPDTQLSWNEMGQWRSATAEYVDRVAESA